MNPPEEIECERIVLRKQHEKYAVQEFDAVNSERARLRKFLGFVDKTRSVDDLLEFIRKSDEDWQSGKAFQYAIFLKKDNSYVGNFGFERISRENKRSELGYFILERYEGQGYISEAIRKVEEILFNLDFNRIEISCFADNDRSKKTAANNKYVLDGVLREYMYRNGKPYDWCVFSKIKI